MTDSTCKPDSPEYIQAVMAGIARVVHEYFAEEFDRTDIRFVVMAVSADNDDVCLSAHNCGDAYPRILDAAAKDFRQRGGLVDETLFPFKPH